MPGSQGYHDYPQPFRIQKRLTLNQCFKTIQAEAGVLDTLTYVTFGGRDLYDAMDLVAVFNIRQHQINIVSYEQDEQVAADSRVRPVAATLSRVATVSIDIVPTEFFENSAPLHKLRGNSRFIYFLDYTGTFGSRQADSLTDLLSDGLLLDQDYLMITSCISPRIVRQPRFMLLYEDAFRLFYGPSITINQEFKIRNHVDLLVGMALSRFERELATASVRQPSLHARLLQKFRYQDTRTPMGLWLYRFERSLIQSPRLDDGIFGEFPHAFAKKEEKEEEIPNIFE